MSLGFDHSKLRYMYDAPGVREKLLSILVPWEREKEVVFIEGGRDLAYGLSVHLDALSIAQATQSKILVIVSGEEDTVLDDLFFLRKRMDLKEVSLAGIIVNKVRNVEEFQNFHLPSILKMGLPVAGVIPYQAELTRFSISYLADRLLAKVVAGEGGLHNPVENILIGAWSADIFIQNPLFRKENKLIITGGDRTDMILASLESSTAGIILTNNILPPSHIMAKAAERNIPLLMVLADTYQTAKQIENLEPLLTKEDTGKIEILKQLVTKHVKMESIFSNRKEAL